MLNDYSYLVSLDCFPLFLHVLTYLINLLPWLRFFRRQQTGGGWRGEDHRVLLHFKSVLKKHQINDRNGRDLQAPEDQGSD